MKPISIVQIIQFCFLLSKSVDRTIAFSQVIKICQNKHCKKEFPSNSNGGDLIQMVQDLIPPADAEGVSIEASGCFSHCGSGPNVCIQHNNNRERVFNGVSDVQTAAAILEVGAAIDTPVALMVAVNMMAQANRTSNQTKKIDILDRVISSLEKENLSQSNAIAHALILRAEAYLDFDVNDPHLALIDATRASEINHQSGRAFRVKADAYEAMGDVLSAIQNVRILAQVNPALVSKARNEINRLSKKQCL